MTLDFKPDEIEMARRVEALLFAAAGPLSLIEIARRLPEGADVAAAITDLQARYTGRGSSWNASPTAGASAPPPTWAS